MDTVTKTPASPLGGASLSVSRSGASRSVASRTTTARPAPARSLAHQLERDRLEQRAARVRQVIHALRDRASVRDAESSAGGVPRPLRAAIEDFGRELAELERRLRHHGPTGA